MSTLPNTLIFTNPGTGQEFGQLAMSTTEDVQRAIADMRSAFPEWSQKPIVARIRILRKFQELMIDCVDEITGVINQDCGKTRQDAMVEVFMTVDLLDSYLHYGKRWLRPYHVPRGLFFFKSCFVEPRPYGVVGVISPWNYPFDLAVAPMLGALLAGNTVVLKPSEVTAATGLFIEKLFKRIPELEPYVRVIHGDGRVGAAFVQSKPDYIFLTGSTATGRLVAQSASANLTPVACELGGKDAMIVLEDADLAAAARWGVWGSFFNAGQTCMGIERVYVHEQVYDKFLTLVLEETQRFSMGYSPDLRTKLSMGPISDPRQLRVIKLHLEDASEKGAHILTGGSVDGNFIAPTVLVDVNHEMRLMREETFGPLMPIVKVSNDEEAIRLANDCEFGLGASVWSRDKAHAWKVARRVEASSVVINDTLVQFAIPMLPFGGIKDSGYGRVHGREGVLQFTRPFSYAVGNPPPSFDIGTIMRSPGKYSLAKAILGITRGASFNQRVKAVGEAIYFVLKKEAGTNEKTLA